MNYTIKQIAEALKAAREQKGLSQRALSAKSGVPQGHISKIENGAVDLRLSSLIDLARVLDLELELVPRKAVPAVQSIVRASDLKLPDISEAARQAAKEVERMKKTLANLPRPALSQKEVEQIQRQVTDMRKFALESVELGKFKELNKTLKTYQENTANLKALHDSLSQAQRLRNELAHNINLPKPAIPRPVYSLDEGDEDG